ncbi:MULTISPECIES: YraN family protein [unclassified Kaistella]|uniref:YraN family protein n=1 Tax=unclassified Kaistella TaxID=2762626 RepID=UPI0027333E8C|nr:MULTISPECIES: YraN family protein [unclassified Kaistella]MDP2453003.1 YraN family protein [Kaistella sp. SH11-4b]MDP2455912.1 YraN family protein [Kaistella sp. SH40-3]MDP2458816.1 YraN family protein [Kaistella sp. SH19-2b]
MAEHNDLGNLAEELAANFLEEKGYKILVKNLRYQKGEIDIIAEFNNQIIIVEVKARGSDIFMEPQEAVTKKKIKSLVMVADFFMKDRNLNKEVRFDIIAVLPDAKGRLQITHLEDAFQSFDAN